MSTTRRSRLMIFTRYPEPGRTKTRLIPALGPDRAADLQRRMTEHALRRLAPLRSSPEAALDLEIRYDGASESAMRGWLGDALHIAPQGDGDLGDRMRRAFEAAFDDGCPRALIVGVDAPRLGPLHVRAAVDALDDCDLVLGPATDGGYYLIALARSAPDLFEGVDWGTETVRERTLAIAERHSMRTVLLEELRDVDRPDDLEEWEAASR